jgi:hypothetical protein
MMDLAMVLDNIERGHKVPVRVVQKKPVHLLHQTISHRGRLRRTMVQCLTVELKAKLKQQLSVQLGEGPVPLQQRH